MKDLIDVEGWPVRGGSRLHAGRIASGTAPVVRHLLEGGAIPLGLVATYELATVGPDPTALYPPARNPRCPDRITGGSSSGSAAAVAGGLVRLALGTDTGGSVRSPAAYCGITGLKPTLGALPLTGVMALSPTLDHVGLLAATAEDAGRAWAALAGLPGRPDDTSTGRIAYARDLASDAPATLERLDAAASMLSLEGRRIDLVTLPDYGEIEAAGLVLIRMEQLVRHADTLRDHAQCIGDMALDSLRAGQDLGAADMAVARTVASRTRAAIDAVLEGRDALILPTVMSPAPRVAAFGHGRAVWTPMRTIPFNMTGHPAISVPMGTIDGLPMGLQIVGRHGAERMILDLAAIFEAATDHTLHLPDRAP